MDNTPAAPSIYPTLRYDDALAGIRFLTEAFGLVADQVLETPDGQVSHALLSWRGGLVMISSRRRDPEAFDTERAVLYLATTDPDAVHKRAVAAGADIVMGLIDQEYGSREFAARDPEGNVWCFGTYQPSVKPG